MFLVFPADFAARSEQVASETPAGRPVGGGGGVGRVPVCDVEVGSFRSETGDFFPLGFTPFGHFFKDEPAVCSARIFDVVISPGFV